MIIPIALFKSMPVLIHCCDAKNYHMLTRVLFRIKTTNKYSFELIQTKTYPFLFLLLYYLITREKIFKKSVTTKLYKNTFTILILLYWLKKPLVLENALSFKDIPNYIIRLRIIYKRSNLCILPHASHAMLVTFTSWTVAEGELVDVNILWLSRHLPMYCTLYCPYLFLSWGSPFT